MPDNKDWIDSYDKFSPYRDAHSYPRFVRGFFEAMYYLNITFGIEWDKDSITWDRQDTDAIVQTDSDLNYLIGFLGDSRGKDRDIKLSQMIGKKKRDLENLKTNAKIEGTTSDGDFVELRGSNLGRGIGWDRGWALQIGNERYTAKDIIKLGLSSRDFTQEEEDWTS